MNHKLLVCNYCLPRQPSSSSVNTVSLLQPRAITHVPVPTIIQLPGLSAHLHPTTLFQYQLSSGCLCLLTSSCPIPEVKPVSLGLVTIFRPYEFTTSIYLFDNIHFLSRNISVCHSSFAIAVIFCLCLPCSSTVDWHTSISSLNLLQQVFAQRCSGDLLSHYILQS